MILAVTNAIYAIAYSEFISAVQYMIYFIYNFVIHSFLSGSLETTNDQLLSSVAS